MARVLVLFPLLFTLAVAGEARTPGARTRETLDSLESRVRASPDDVIAWNKIAEARLRLLGTTGHLVNLARAREAVERSLTISAPEFNHGALALRVRIELASHRFHEAQASAQQLCTIKPDSAYSLGLLGDAYFNLGEYAACERVWNQMLALDKSVLMAEPRLAQLDLVHGRLEQARERYEKVLQAARALEREVPNVLAWSHVQLGELAFRSGDWETAAQNYDEALAAQPGYYAALDHKAELRGAQGRFEEAVALYSDLIEQVARPEFLQALGDLYLFAAKTAEARSWHARAVAAYLVSVEQGETMYFHHLAGLYADSLSDPVRAVEWARRDLTTRQGIQAYDTLAWAFYKAGMVKEAQEAISCALALGTRDPHILYHAGMILMRAGDVTKGTARLQEALAANPRYNTFHVHRG